MWRTTFSSKLTKISFPAVESEASKADLIEMFRGYRNAVISIGFMHTQSDYSNRCNNHWQLEQRLSIFQSVERRASLSNDWVNLFLHWTVANKRIFTSVVPREFANSNYFSSRSMGETMTRVEGDLKSLSGSIIGVLVVLVSSLASVICHHCFECFCSTF